ncbi:MAG TPA: TonB-dependent receptor, partial [Pyrinomonadaceae bacterium]|nr:TonB-dependent receptor [Pyrinomonadaceae bacterium]
MICFSFAAVLGPNGKYVGGSSTAHAQSATATLSGTVYDENDSVIPDVTITVINRGTSLTRQVTTNGEGGFTVPLLPPTKYTVRAEREGFATAEFNDVVLNVNDQVSLKILLKVTRVGETVNVNDSASLTRESPAVSTVVDRQFVENLPLNGRSFQSLIALTPGTVLTKASLGEPGQFSVNGQRANANYFMVDGVSANIGVSSGAALSQSAGGALPGFSAFGGTNNLVSVDALQEFKILTSTYAPEFGRTPGGQISLITRSGTNDFRGSIFEYFRNDALDAKDWFANRNKNPKPALRQNDFGGVLGGPIIKNRTFFFFSYEGLRLRLPQTLPAVVPSLSARQSAPAALRPILSAYPIPNGRVFSTGLAEFVASYSDPLDSDATGIRLDHTINNHLTIFGRYNYAPSESVQRFNSLNNLISSRFKTQTFTTGLIHNISPSTTHDLRFNYSRSTGSSFFRLDNLGGAVPPADSILFPPFASSNTGGVSIQISGAASLSVGRSGDNMQRQFNLVDNLSVIINSHQLKFGIDYRRLTPTSGVPEYRQSASFSGMGVTSPGIPPPAGSVLSGKPSSISISARESIDFLYANFSAYGQDTWRVTPRLTLTYGLRWEVNPPPKGRDGKELFTLALNGDPATIILSPAGAPLAPQGTPLYETTYNNFAPRAGIAYQLSQRNGMGTVLRGGFGVFYDLGNSAGLNVNSLFPYSRSKNVFGEAFPLTDPTLAQPPAFSLTPSRNSSMFVYDPKLKLPITYQWNVTLEQSLGSNQTVSASYVAAAGRRLLRQEMLTNVNPSPTFTSVRFYRNSATSDYHALQLQFQRRLSKGLQALASYTFSKS